MPRNLNYVDEAKETTTNLSLHLSNESNFIGVFVVVVVVERNPQGLQIITRFTVGWPKMIYVSL